MARKMHYTVRSNPLPIICYPAFPVSSPSPSRCSRFSPYPTRSVRLTLSLSLARSAPFPLPVRARCKNFAGHLLTPLFLGPPSRLLDP